MIEALLIYISIFTLTYFARKEFLDILGFEPIYISDKEIHEASVKKIYKEYLNGNRFYGIFYVFRFPILFILLILNYLLFLYLNYSHINNFILFISIYSLITFSIHIILPLNRIYFPAIEDSFKYKISINEWFNYKYLIMNKDSKYKEIDSKIKKFYIGSYEDYLLNFITLDLEPLTYEEYKKYIFHLDKYNLICKDKGRYIDIFIEGDKLEFFYISLYPDNVYTSINKMEPFERKIFERVGDSLAFFMVVYLINNYWS